MGSGARDDAVEKYGNCHRDVFRVRLGVDDGRRLKGVHMAFLTRQPPSRLIGAKFMSL